MPKRLRCDLISLALQPVAWIRAMNLTPERRITRSDVIDASTYMNLRDLKPEYKGLNPGFLDLGGLPHAENLVINGEERSASREKPLNCDLGGIRSYQPRWCDFRSASAGRHFWANGSDATFCGLR